jgi:hypothetical protein
MRVTRDSMPLISSIRRALPPARTIHAPATPAPVRTWPISSARTSSGTPYSSSSAVRSAIETPIRAVSIRDTFDCDQPRASATCPPGIRIRLRISLSCSPSHRREYSSATHPFCPGAFPITPSIIDMLHCLPDLA